MGVWDWMKGLLAAREYPAPDYGAMSDEELVGLWPTRGDLTDVAREALVAECERRELAVAKRKKRRPARVEPTVVFEPPNEKLSGDLLEMAPGLGILLRTTPNRWALIHLPLWDPTAPDLPAHIELDAIVVCNDQPRGWLFTTKLREAAGLAADRVFSIADGPVDRSIGATTGTATPLPRSAILGLLRLEIIGAGHALRARWKDSEVEVVAGAMLEHVDSKRPIIRVGSLPPPDETMAWRAMLHAAHTTAMMSLAGMGGTPMHVLVLADAVGSHPDAHGLRDVGMGVQVVGRPCPVSIDAVGALGCISSERWDLLDEHLQIEGVATDLATHFIIEADLDRAARVLDCAKKHAQEDLSCVEAALRALRGDIDGAIARLEERQPAGKPDAALLADLAMLQASRGNFEDSNRHARGAIELMWDWSSQVTACRALWLAGLGEEARAALSRAAIGIRASLSSPEEALLETQPPAAPSPPAFPLLAEAARRRARRAPSEAEVERHLRRAAELDPQSLV